MVSVSPLRCRADIDTVAATCTVEWRHLNAELILLGICNTLLELCSLWCSSGLLLGGEAPIILAKSCHDLDILRWLIGKPCETIAAEGSLHLFRPENMPKGAPERCTDGCPHEAECPYSAIDIYERRKRHLHVFDLPRKDPALIHEKLKTSNYGRCVFRCNNDQCDHYVAIMKFEGDVTASFTMDAFTPWGGRRTRIM